MRDLIVSIAAVSLLIGAWFIFDGYSENRIDYLTQTIQDEIIPLVEAGSWEESSQQISDLHDIWHKYRAAALLFLDTDSVNEIDYSMVKTIEYIHANDVSNASGELMVIYKQLQFLRANDLVMLSNIL